MKIRTTCPKNNKYYIRTVTGGLNGAVAGDPTQPYANVLDNCVGFANGRFNEAWNDPELEGIVKPFHVQLTCNAENFIESAKRQDLKISSTPVVGGIMVWQKGATLSGGDGAGHVAFVERVYDDGTILTSESGWASWAFKTVRRDNSNGRWGQNANYKFRGCIINPAIKNVITPAPKLSVDGVGGACTVRAMQRFFGTVQDGVLSGQNKSLNKYYPALEAVEYGKGGSPCVKNLQKWVGTTQDGIIGEVTVKAWQKKIDVTADGIFGTNSMKAWQEYLNEHDKAVYPTPSVDYYKVIDVSDWQGQIDWAKVKADGVVGAIIRYGDGNVLDKRFAENMKNAKAAGLHIGSYIFSRAKNIAEAEAEATKLYNACKPYSPDMPLYIDLEAKGLEKYANVVAQAFLVKMKALGGRGGVYASLNWWNNYLVGTAKNYSSNPFWIAQYNSTMDYKPADKMGMWQYTSSGSVDGISGKVDMDKCYVAYWEKTEPTVNWVDRANAWAKMIADCNDFHYVKWTSKDKATQTCPICTKRVILDAVYDAAKKVFKLLGIKINCDKKYVGYNCIGFSFAVWHHGGGLPCKCSDGVIANEIWEKILNAKTDAEALALAQKHVGLKELKVIRNKNGIPKSQWKAGDIMGKFNGEKYIHTFYYMGNGKIAESTGSSGKVPVNEQIRIKSYDKTSAKVIVRYTGK